MKILLLTLVFIPALAAAQSYKCVIDNNSFIKLKINDQMNITADIINNKKVATSCLFNAQLPGSDPRGASGSVIQNFSKTGCSKLEGKEIFKVSDKAYTKIRHDKKQAVFFMLSNHHPFDCSLI